MHSHLYRFEETKSRRERGFRQLDENTLVFFLTGSIALCESKFTPKYVAASSIREGGWKRERPQFDLDYGKYQNH
jgi:hypothetical protein